MDNSFPPSLAKTVLPFVCGDAAGVNVTVVASGDDGRGNGLEFYGLTNGTEKVLTSAIAGSLTNGFGLTLFDYGSAGSVTPPFILLTRGVASNNTDFAAVIGDHRLPVSAQGSYFEFAPSISLDGGITFQLSQVFSVDATGNAVFAGNLHILNSIVADGNCSYVAGGQMSFTGISDTELYSPSFVFKDLTAAPMMSLAGGILNVTNSYQIAGTQVITTQQSAIADSAYALSVDPGIADVSTQLNLLLAAVRTHGLIAT